MEPEAWSPLTADPAGPYPLVACSSAFVTPAKSLNPAVILLIGDHSKKFEMADLSVQFLSHTIRFNN